MSPFCLQSQLILRTSLSTAKILLKKPMQATARAGVFFETETQSIWCIFKQSIQGLSVQFMAPVSLHQLDTG